MSINLLGYCKRRNNLTYIEGLGSWLFKGTIDEEVIVIIFFHPKSNNFMPLMSFDEMNKMN